VAEVVDGFDTYYAERLWLLLPAVYRTADTDDVDGIGPLRELINRIGAQMAVIRRSIDQLWEDQSIETCADWVIPYIGDLLATNLVNNLDPDSQRLDVAKTIHYRNRKGTVQIVEELGRDATGWTARAGEGFRRLSRTRHGLDPAVGAGAFPGTATDAVAALLAAEQLTGLLSGTPAGGLADLRSAHGAALTGGPFDEAFHTADFRRGQGAVGLEGIAKLLVFVWRLASFPVIGGTPVAVAGAARRYVFDPTGREIPLFLPTPAAIDDFSGAWSPAPEWQVPGPLTDSLERALSDTGSETLPPHAPYPAPPGGLPARYGVSGAEIASVSPEHGEFTTTTAAPAGPLTVDYQYGFSGRIGAGPYNRDLLGDPPAVSGKEKVVSGGSGLDAALAAAQPTATITLADSLTYPAVASPPGSVVALLVRAGPGQRPVIRTSPGTEWVFTGGPGAQLVLDGLTISGCDVVLRGAFDSVRLTACTIDPGTAASGTPPLADSVDGRPLAPGRIFVEPDPSAPGGIATLELDHCIVGPIRSRLGGSVDQLAITDSIVQGLPAGGGTVVFDPVALASGLLAGQPAAGSPFPVSAAVLAAIPGLAAALAAYLAQPAATLSGGLPLAVLNALDTLIVGPSIYNPALFAGVPLSPRVQALAQAPQLDATKRIELNRGLLQDAFPVALGVAALALTDATVGLSRVTVLGRIAVRELSANDSIMADFVTAEDTQAGCVRFSACLTGSVIPRQYESVAIGSGGCLFRSTRYGRPDYAQLVETADSAVVARSDGLGSILRGAENGSEMGAFCAELGSSEEQGLLVKYTEYMPLGLTPVIVHVT
jgi:hypothetical protein